MEETTITENFSVNKPKRGRPQKILNNDLTYNQWIAKTGSEGLLSPDNKSARSHKNYYYLLKAWEALRSNAGKNPLDGEFAFILSADDKNLYDAQVKNFKKTILQELGRLEDRDLIRSAAKQICIDKLKTSEAVALAREYRRKSAKTPQPSELSKKLFKVIEDFNSIYYETDTKFIMEALYLTQIAISEKFS